MNLGQTLANLLSLAKLALVTWTAMALAVVVGLFLLLGLLGLLFGG